MARTELDSYRLFLNDEFEDMAKLSDDALAAYYKLRYHFFRTGQLPKTEDAIERIAKLDRPRQWQKVRAELQNGVFSNEWQHPIWIRTLRITEAQLLKDRARTAPATQARKANASARREESAPAPDIDPDYEPIPF